ncbi:MAG: PEGA domain-containing protein, partial [Acidobacteria bacterium]|nr:PEGA domain-containing protein [Acidobacteriota bacterium]
LRFGKYTIRVVQSGYATARENVTISAAAPSRRLSFQLQRNAAPAPRPAPRAAESDPSERPAIYTGSIYVDSRPRGARVLVDGKFLGTTPVRIPDMGIGSHIVRLQLVDHLDWTSTTRVTAGQESRVSGSLERIK